MTPSNGEIFRVTVPFWGKSNGHRWIPLTKAIDTELWCFLWSVPHKWLSKQSRRRWFETPLRYLWRHCKENRVYILWAVMLWVQCSDNVVNTSWLMPVVSLDTTMSRHTHFTAVTKYFFHGTLDIFTTGMLVARWHWKNRYRASLSLWWILEPGFRHKHCPDGINTTRESSWAQADISTDTQFFVDWTTFGAFQKRFYK